ncbi:DUF4345 family protein [Silanimonas sp.]|jgi:hypothetical protein|uniref:DUF4345 family protein n=1 Tax=Silanimonas sp. TaxID=1929290 RepID=UPI0037CBA34B
MNAFRIAVLALAGLGFLGFGLWFLVDPIGPLADIGITATGAPAATEFRAFYGGLEVGLGLLMLVAAAKPDWRMAGLWLVIATNGGIAAGRLVGVAVDGVWVPFFTYALVWEVGFAVLAAIGLKAAGPRE